MSARGRKPLLSALAFLFAACAGAQAERTRPDTPRTPFSVAASPASAAATAPSYDLREFVPLLAEPLLSGVAEALENDDSLLAVARLRALLAERPRAAAEVRYRYLFASLAERAGRLDEAASAYTAAAEIDWPLRDYARWGAARVLVKKGAPERAERLLLEINPRLPFQHEVELLRAEASLLLGRHAMALASFRAYLERDSPPAAWPGVALRMAGLLLSPDTPPTQVGPIQAEQRAKTSPASAADSPAATDAKGAISPNDAREALALVRRVLRTVVTDEELSQRATELEARALSALPPADRDAAKRLVPSEALSRLIALVEARRAEDAERLAEEILSELGKERFNDIGCEVGFLRGKAIALQRRWGEAANAYPAFIDRCRGDLDLRARLLFVAGKYAAADGRHTQAEHWFEELEQTAKTHRLADDARLHRAESYLKIGVEARFTELLSRMPDDYPSGDMTSEGSFRLALRRIEKNDWPGAAAVLARAAEFTRASDATRGQEYSGQERYFLARSLLEIGDRERALAELASIVEQLPLSYYMLHAYSRLKSIDPRAAEAARKRGEERARSSPFRFDKPAEFEDPGFVRAVELLRQSEIELAKDELSALGLLHESRAPSILWGVSLLYQRAGALRLSHSVAAGLLTDWLSHWPTGPWSEAWQLAFPRPHLELVLREAKRNQIDEFLAYAVMREESAFDASARSTADAYGLMQLIVPTARSFAKPLGLPHDPRSLVLPEINITLGCRVLGELTHKTFGGQPLMAIPGYNAGPGRPRQWLRERPNVDYDVWIELIPLRETRRYTKRVLTSRAVYAALYHPDLSERALTLPISLP